MESTAGVHGDGVPNVGYNPRNGIIPVDAVKLSGHGFNPRHGIIPIEMQSAAGVHGDGVPNVGFNPRNGIIPIEMQSADDVHGDDAANASFYPGYGITAIEAGGLSGLQSGHITGFNPRIGIAPVETENLPYMAESNLQNYGFNPRHGIIPVEMEKIPGVPDGTAHHIGFNPRHGMNLLEIGGIYCTQDNNLRNDNISQQQVTNIAPLETSPGHGGLDVNVMARCFDIPQSRHSTAQDGIVNCQDELGVTSGPTGPTQRPLDEGTIAARGCLEQCATGEMPNSQQSSMATSPMHTMPEEQSTKKPYHYGQYAQTVPVF
jgi:hypothetical protein